jgi:hypothetical protein
MIPIDWGQRSNRPGRKSGTRAERAAPHQCKIGADIAIMPKLGKVNDRLDL